MNEPTPLTPDAVDALLSAEIDGDLEAAARDLGLDASSAHARLAATPGVDDRRAALTRARDLLASRPLLESSVADRIIATALAGDELAAARGRRTQSQRRWRVLVATGSVAAAIAVIVGVSSMDTSPSPSKPVAAADSTTEPSRTPESAKGAGGQTTAGANSARPDLGDVSDAAALRAPAQQLLELKRSRAASPTATPTGSGVPVPTEAFDGSADAAGGAYSKAGRTCIAKRVQLLDRGGSPALIAEGTVAGSPVVILIYDSKGADARAYVIRVRDCALLADQPLG